MSKRPAKRAKRAKRQEEILWIEKNRDFLWKNYPGKWIAVVGEQLVGLGDTPDDAIEEAAAKGYADPLVDGVRKKEYQGVILIRRL